MVLDALTLTPATATVIFVAAVISGYSYRRVWKADGPHWQLWLYGTLAAVCLMIVAFIPLEVS